MKIEGRQSYERSLRETERERSLTVEAERVSVPIP